MKPPPEGRVREVLVLGATGYVGGRLVSELLDAGHQVRVLTRSPDRAERYEWSGRVRLFTGDVLDASTLAPAFEGCDAVYYLVHSIGTSGDFAATEAIAALNPRAMPRTPPGAAASCISAAWDAAMHSPRTWRAATRWARSSPRAARRPPSSEQR